MVNRRLTCFSNISINKYVSKMIQYSKHIYEYNFSDYTYPSLVSFFIHGDLMKKTSIIFWNHFWALWKIMPKIWHHFCRKKSLYGLDLFPLTSYINMWHSLSKHYWSFACLFIFYISSCIQFLNKLKWWKLENVFETF